MLTQYQKNNLKSLKEAMKTNNELAIVGSTGSGRKYVIEQLGKETPRTIVLKLDRTNINLQYSSLTSAMRDIEFFRKKTLKIGSSLSIPSVLGSINTSLEADTIFKDENEIKKSLVRISKKHSIIFVIDKSIDITDGSIEIIENFQKECNKQNNIYIIYISNKTLRNKNNVIFDDISNCGYSHLEILKELGLDSCVIPSEKVINFIFLNINNNIQLLIEIINDLNNNILDCKLETHDTNHVIDKLLDGVNKEYEYVEQLNDLLSICAISEHYFKSIDLAYLLNEHESVVNLLLEYAHKHYLVKNDNDSYTILFGLVRKIYAGLDEYSKCKLYVNIVGMFESIHPSNYSKKYLFAKLADMRESTRYLIQYLFSEIRLNHNIDFDKYKKELSEKEFNIVKTYSKAVGYNNSKQYEKCIDTLSSIRGLNSELLYEINLLKSQCLIKKLDEPSRNKAIALLNYDNTIKDENLKFRLNIRKIAAQVHVGQHTNAQISCEQTIGYLINKLEETGSIEYEYYINVIYRKYSYVSSYDTSVYEVAQSVLFFRKNMNEYHKGYYIALNNLLSLYLINMQLSKAIETKNELEELIITKNNISFPRKEIMDNNILLLCYFNKTMHINEICDAFKKLYEETRGSADNVLIASNYSVFLMLNNEFQMAEKILLDGIPGTNNDQEGIYDTRVKINLAICKFLMNNANRDSCINSLKAVEYNVEAPYYDVRVEELKNIIELMCSIEKCNDANKWCEAFKASLTTPFTSYTTYQQGFVYTTLFNWDDD